MKKFSISYSKIYTQEVLEKYSNKIYDIYFPYPFLLSAIPDSTNLNDVRDIVRLCNQFGIRKHMICNAICFEKIPQDNLIQFCEDENIDSIGIANYFLMEKIYEDKIRQNSSIDIESSVHSFILNKEHYDMIKSMINSVAMAVDAIFDQDLITYILNDDKKIKLVVNDGCIFKCPFKRIHLGLNSHDIYPRATSTSFCIDFEVFTEQNLVDLPVKLPEENEIEGIIWKLNTRVISKNSKYMDVINIYLGERQPQNKYEMLIVPKWQKFG